MIAPGVVSKIATVCVEEYVPDATLKAGTATGRLGIFTVEYALAARLSEVPVMVTANDWGCANTLAVKVSTLVPFVGLVLNDAVTPEGSAEVTAKDTLPEKPPV